MPIRNFSGKFSFNVLDNTKSVIAYNKSIVEIRKPQRDYRENIYDDNWSSFAGIEKSISYKHLTDYIVRFRYWNRPPKG